MLKQRQTQPPCLSRIASSQALSLRVKLCELLVRHILAGRVSLRFLLRRLRGLLRLGLPLTVVTMFGLPTPFVVSVATPP